MVIMKSNSSLGVVPFGINWEWTRVSSRSSRSSFLAKKVKIKIQSSLKLRQKKIQKQRKINHFNGNYNTKKKKKNPKKCQKLQKIIKL